MDVKHRQQAISRILMKAWRERWTEYEFGLQIKLAFGKGPRLPIDSYNLTDAILQQTLIGAGVNKLLLSYLKHSLFSQLISYPAVIKRTTQYVHFEKYYCIKALLDFLISIIERVTCRSKAEETALMESLLSLVCWLMEMTEKLLSKVMETNNVATKEQEQCLERVATFTHTIVQNQFLMGVLYLAKLEDRDAYEKLVNGYKKIHSWNNQHDAVKDLYQMVFVKLDQMEMKELEPRNVEKISYCLQPFMSIEVLVHRSADISTHVSKFLMIQKLKKYSMSRLYFEVIRSCFMTMCHVKEFNYRLWASFFLFKVPQILKQLHLQTKNLDDKLDYSEDIVKAFEMLLESTPILDLLDTTFQCNSVKSILVELMKQNLINEENHKKIVERRELAIEKLENFNISSTTPSINEFAQTIDPAFRGLIVALRDSIKQEQLMLLCTLLVDNRAFMLYSVAGVKGKHETMINGIMKLNDSCKDFYGEAAKKLTVGFCSNMFDLTFVLLYSIMQQCGLENFPDMNGDFFFEKWVRDGMTDSVKPKSPMSIVKMCDQSKVDEMVGYFRDNSNQQQPAISFKWSEICMNLPAMLYNVLIAWENETINPAEVKNILDNMRSKMCCFAVISASWLCAYMK